MKAKKISTNELINILFKLIEILRPKYNLDMQFSELSS